MISRGVSMEPGFNLKGLYIGIVLSLLLSFMGLFVINLANESRSQLTRFAEIPEFEFFERDGSPFGKNNMLGKVNIVNFFFTNCQGPCPFMNSKVAELYKKYATSDKVQFVSISVDPERDSLPVLREYANSYGVKDKRWVFLRGELNKIHDLSEKGFLLAGEFPNLHSIKLILVDATGYVRGYYSSYSEESLKVLTTHVKELIRNM
jgi:protein SCO1/2